MKSPLHILHLEDDLNDAVLAQMTLNAGGVACETVRVETRADFVAALDRRGHDLVIADFAVPSFDGLSALDMVRAKYPDLPFILLSGTVGEEFAIECLKSGATDYVLKGRMSRLVPSVRRAMLEVEQRLARQQAEEGRQEYSSKLQVLSRRLVDAQETERRNIARELHDEIGQSLTVAQLNLQAILQSAPKAQMDKLTQTLAVVERLLEQVHELSLNLRPSMLDDLGLEPTLRWYAKRQAALTGIKTTVVADPLAERLDTVVETECFRVMQEALTNVARHSRARTVEVALRQDGGHLRLRVRDDGVGFNVAASRSQAVHGASLGLLSMEERAALAGGGLEFESSPGQGAEVHAWFPLTWRSPTSMGTE